jgi:hypothetical protein
MIRGCLVILMVLCGGAVALLLHTLVSPVWVVATDTPLGALPYVQALPLGPANSSSSSSIAASLRPLPAYALGTLQYCVADGGVCELKSSAGFGAETSCGRSATSVEYMYIACIVCAALAVVCFGAAGILSGRPAFTSDPARLGNVNYDVDDAANAAPATATTATTVTRARSNEPVASPGNSNTNSTGDGAALADSTDTKPPTTAVNNNNNNSRSNNSADPVAMSMQVDDSEGEEHTTRTVVVQPASVTKARLAAKQEALAQHAKRRMTRSVFPAVLGALLTWVSAFIVLYMHEWWLHCGESTVDRINSAAAQLGGSGSAERGVSVWLVLAASGCGLLAALMLPCLRSQAAAAARAEFEDDDDNEGDNDSSSDDGGDDNAAVTSLAPPPNGMDEMSFSRDMEHMRVEAARSPPIRSPIAGMEHGSRREPSQLIVESPDERDHL